MSTAEVKRLQPIVSGNKENAPGAAKSTSGAPVDLSAVADAYASIASSGGNTNMRDAMKLAMQQVTQSQESVAVSYGKRSMYAVDIKGVVLRARFNEYKPKSGNGQATRTCAYTIRVLDATTNVAQLVRDKHPAIGGTESGFRFTRSDDLKKKATLDTKAYFGTYSNIVKAAHAGKPTEAETLKVLEQQQADVDAGKSFHVNLKAAPFAGDPRCEIASGKIIYVDVFVGSKKEVAGDYTQVQISGLAVDAYAYTPKPEAAGTVPSAFNKNMGGGGGGDDEDDAEDDTANNNTMAHMPNYVAQDGTQFRIKLKASSVTMLPDEINKLSLAQRAAFLVPMWSQIIYNPKANVKPPNMTYSPILVVSPVAPTIPEFVKEHFSCLLHVGANSYTRNGLEGSERDPGTFTQKMKETQRAVYPIVLKVTNVQVASNDDELESLVPFYPERRPINEQFTSLQRTLVIKALLWPSKCRLSGITDIVSWLDVNTYRPLDVTMVFGSSHKVILGETLELYPSQADWHMIPYLETFGTPISLDLAKVLLGNEVDLKNGEFLPEQDNEGKEQVVRNMVNTDPVMSQYLLNGSEFTGKIDKHLLPANGWQARALIVPKRLAFSNFPVEKQKRIEDALATLRSIKTPTDGDAAVTKLHKRFSKEEDVLAGFANRVSDIAELRCIVFFYKPESTRFTAATLAKLDPVEIAKAYLGNEARAQPKEVQQQVKDEMEGVTSNVADASASTVTSQVSGKRRERSQDDESHSQSSGGKGKKKPLEPAAKRPRLDPAPVAEKDEEDGDEDYKDDGGEKELMDEDDDIEDSGIED